jgi:hypothetical protein
VRESNQSMNNKMRKLRPTTATVNKSYSKGNHIGANINRSTIEYGTNKDMDVNN